MRHIASEGGYPVWIEEIAKADTPWHDADEIAAALQERILRCGAAFIAVFDHYGLNLRMGEALPAAMQDAKTILFCPCAKLLDPLLLALSPCAIGVADMGNRFVISFQASPVFTPTKTLSLWVDDLRTP